MNRNYITSIEGNETVLVQYVAAVLAGTCRARATYPFPYRLSGCPDCLNTPLIGYFLRQEPFELARVEEFFNQLRRLDKRGFNGIYYSFDQWVKATIEEPYFTKQPEPNARQLVRRPDADPAGLNPEHVRFMCFLAVCHRKYGPSWSYITAQEYFDMATALGSDEPAKLKLFGSGRLPPALTVCEAETVRCVANDAFATIRITMRQATEAGYRRALEFVNALLQADFPRSYGISFISPEKHYLPVRGLPKKGVHAFFAGAARYESLHPLLVEYATRAMRPDEWYLDLPDEQCALPGTFAVLALGWVSEAYFGLLRQYLQTVDEEHQSIHQKYTPAFVEKFGITEDSLPVFIGFVLSVQQHEPSRVVAEAFAARRPLELLLACRREFGSYLPEAADATDDAEGLATYLWQNVLHTIFGPEKTRLKLSKSASDDLRPLYTELFATA